MQSGAKNPPWARSNVNSNMTGMNPQMMDPNAMAMSQQGMLPFQQSQAVFNPNMMQTQSGLSMQMGGQMPMNQMGQGQMYPGNVVAYPTPRAMNPGMYQSNQANQQQPNNTEQRVFTGTVTKTHNDFGFVDHDVFYQTSVCAKGVIPKVNDRVLVEASYNPNMPFKWNATRVQVLPKGGPNQNQNKGGGGQHKSNYNAVPPPANSKKGIQNRRDDRPPRREDRIERKRSRTRSRSRSRNHGDSQSRRRDSPPRKRPTVREPSPVKYVVRVPRMPLDITNVDVPTLSQRYTNMYIPSDFFSAQVRWGETFPPESPFSLNNSCSYHIMNKEVELPGGNDTVLEPPDADYRYSAKVMLISVPTLELFYQKCGLTKPDEKDKRNNKNPLHPTRLIKFLVGQKGKGGENFAIGGPWSPSLDGENPQSDPTVLVKTAIRTCKALTGIDLTPCTQWYRMVEFYYWRESSGGKSRLETVVLFLPDVWSAQCSRVEWPDVLERYKAACEASLQRLSEPDAAPATAAAAQPADGADSQPADSSLIENKSANDSSITIEDNDDDEDMPEATHYSNLDMKTIKVDQLRQELRARKSSCKGLRAQLISRLSKMLKAEEEKEKEEVTVVEDEDGENKTETKDKAETEKQKEADSNDNDTIEIKDDKDEKKDGKKDGDKKPAEKTKEKSEKDIEKEKEKLEKEKQTLKSRYELPTTPHMIVHPSTVAKGGKFNCSVATLSLLLDYRITDNKEHSFELFVFAELFNEMLMRDFGFYIYKTLYTLPEKVEEPKEKPAEKTDKKEDKAEKKDDKEKKEEKEKKDDKRDDRKDSRRRDRRDSHSDDERSNSPSKKSGGVDLPSDPYLLLSLVYFDTSRCGYFIKKDLQNLFMSLGLRLSRSQIRGILEKVCVKDNFTYKTLTQAIKDLASGSADMMQDLPLETTVNASSEVPPHIAELEATIAAGNRELLPVFKTGTDDAGDEAASGTADVGKTGMVMFKSRLVDIGATLAALSRSEQQRNRLETALSEARAVARTMRAAAAQTQAASRGAQHQLSDLTDQLQQAKTRVASLTASSKIFHSALKSIQSKVEAVVNIKYEDDDVVEVVNGPSKVDKKEVKKADVKAEEAKPSEQKQTPAAEECNNEDKPKTEVKTDKETPADKTVVIQDEVMDLDDKE